MCDRGIDGCRLVCCLLFGAVLFGVHTAFAQFTYTTISDPQGTSTYCEGVSGNTIVGYYVNSSGNDNGFVDNNGSFTTIDDPFAFGQFGTQVVGISGNTIVGAYQDSRTGTVRGFIDSAGTFTPLDAPAAAGITQITGISGNSVIGFYEDSDYAWHSFEYNVAAQTFTILNETAPTRDNSGTYAMGISGDTIVGYYASPTSNSAGSSTHAFSLTGSTYTNFDYPESTSGTTVTDPLATIAAGISGNLVVGTTQIQYTTNTGHGLTFLDVSSGFLYDGATFTLLNVPSSESEFGYGTDAQAISGNTVVGYYNVDANTYEGFETTVPEPASICFLLAPVLLLKRRRGSRAT
ncbi:MAG TPA: hypothetical protein VL992_12610 [Tepidisphaeraceae bacterium]|nr:hypothetical protein [Tepidisphaeraceae bacterium]